MHWTFLRFYHLFYNLKKQVYQLQKLISNNMAANVQLKLLDLIFAAILSITGKSTLKQ